MIKHFSSFIFIDFTMQFYYLADGTINGIVAAMEVNEQEPKA